MIYLKSNEEIAVIREGGRILSAILAELAGLVRPGTDTAELEELALRRMKEAGGEPAFKGYRIEGVRRAFPTALCASINQEVVHGFAIPGRRVDEGDLLKLDIGLHYRGGYTDMAMTVPVGRVSAPAERLVRVTKESLNAGLKKVRAGGWIRDIGKAVDARVRRDGFTTVKALCGHGVGRQVHEDPQIPNYLDRSLEPVRIVKGMVLAIEPMVNAGGDDVHTLADEWTVATTDGSLSAHFEVTVALTDDGPEILTPQPGVELE